MTNTHKAAVLDRFLRYVQIDTTSDPLAEDYPSTKKQFDLLDLLADELRALGVQNVTRDEWGYVMATLPATLPADVLAARAVPTIGFVAHVDTSPEVSGTNVKPQLIERYEGGVIHLPGDPTQVIDPAEQTDLDGCIGHTLVTSDGTTLLGADDKAGVAEIMTAVEYLLAHPEIERGPIAIGFTPDEEVGRGTEYFDIERFGARYAYTLDGGKAGGYEFETFSADSALLTVRGRNQHPGTSKDKMVNAVKLAAHFISLLPDGRLSPETTEGYEGFVHPHTIEGGVEETIVRFILRDFADAKLTEYRALLESIAQQVRTLEPRAELTLEYKESYRNMRDALNRVPHVVEYAAEAIRRVGLEPWSEPIRGGTDGSRLTAMGLPTPNLFTGGRNYHSKREWASADEMSQAVQMIVELARLWGERGDATTA